MYENAMNTDSGLGMIIAMLWVFGLMGAVMTVFITQRLEERTMRMRVGIEIEVIKDHGIEAPNHSIANWLEIKSHEDGDKYNAKYIKTLKKRQRECRKTQYQRRQEVARSLPDTYFGKHWYVRDERWTQGQTSDATKVISDGSLSSGGFEVVSQPLMDGEHHGWLSKIAHLLRHITRIDRSCGLHVHIGLRDPHSSFRAGG